MIEVIPEVFPGPPWGSISKERSAAVDPFETTAAALWPPAEEWNQFGIER
jgi:hypothetical protein